MTKEELRKRRKDLGLTQKALGKICYNRDKSTVWRWENGHVPVPPWVAGALDKHESIQKENPPE